MASNGTSTTSVAPQQNALLEFYENLGFPIPWWAAVAIVAVALILILIILILICKCCCCKKSRSGGGGGGCGCCCRKTPKGVSRKGTVKSKDVQALGQAYREKVQPDLEELNLNMEDNEGATTKSAADYLGKLHFTLDYNFQSTELTVGVVECTDVKAMDSGGTSDPFIRIHLAPDEKKKFETKVQEKTLNPVFNETFVFKVAYSEVTTKTLVFKLFDFDRFSASDHIGQVKIALNSIDFGNSIDRWSELQIPDSEADKDSTLGDVCFSLRYVPTAGKLTVIVLEAKNLRKMDVTGLSDPYVKTSLFMGGKRLKKKKTTVKRKTLNPYYNESFTFDVKFEDIEKVSLVVTVVDYDLIGASDPIGQVSVGCRSSGIPLKHWSEMLANPRRPIAMWHSLKAISEPKK